MTLLCHTKFIKRKRRFLFWLLSFFLNWFLDKLRSNKNSDSYRDQANTNAARIFPGQRTESLIIYMSFLVSQGKDETPPSRIKFGINCVMRSNGRRWFFADNVYSNMGLTESESRRWKFSFDWGLVLYRFAFRILLIVVFLYLCKGVFLWPKNFKIKILWQKKK